MILLKIFSALTFQMGVQAASSPGLPKLEVVGKTQIPAQFKFKKSQVGGLSGLFFDSDKGTWWAVSDDRGRVDEPRFFELNFWIDATKKFQVEVKDVVYLQESKGKRWARPGVDLEALVRLKDGSFLLASEGDAGTKPRVCPFVVFSASPQVAKNLEKASVSEVSSTLSLPDDYCPESTGEQKKGIYNNKGPEGLTLSLDQSKFWLGLEFPLMPESADPKRVRIQEYQKGVAADWKPGPFYFYDKEPVSSEALYQETGLSELLSFSSQEILALERTAAVTLQGVRFDSSLFLFLLKEPQQSVVKKKWARLADLDPELQGNFESMAWGPDWIDGRKTLILGTDNDLEKNRPSVFWLIAISSQE